MKNKFLFLIGQSLRKNRFRVGFGIKLAYRTLKGSILAQNAEFSSDLCPTEQFYDPFIGPDQQPMSEEVLQQLCRIPATGYAIKACMSYCQKGQFQTISQETCYRADTIKDLGNIRKFEKMSFNSRFIQVRPAQQENMAHTVLRVWSIQYGPYLNLNLSVLSSGFLAI